MSARTTVQWHGDASEEPEDLFVALLHTFEPYIDDILTPAKFHRFLNLPTELRCKIYEQYFLDNIDSVICKDWPTVRIASRVPEDKERGRGARSLIPNICLINEALQDEVFSCLMHPMEFEFSNSLTTDKGLYALARSFKSVSLLACMREITIRNSNGQRGIMLEQYTLSPSASRIRSSIKHLDLVVNILQRIPNLRQLNLEVWAPFDLEISRKVKAVPIHDYIVHFNIQEFAKLRELQRLKIIAKSSHQRYDNTNDDWVKENLLAVTGFAQSIRDCFKSQRQDVLVEIQFKCGNDKEIAVCARLD